jgi:putative spermidine/putrescine transport system ATP-binding protein
MPVIASAPAPSPETPMVRLVEVSRRFGGTVAVDRINLELPRGAFLTILGPSGCGKTTLLRMIAGFIAPSSGQIFVHGRPVGDLPPWKRSIGMVFQRLALFPHLTAFGNVAYPLQMRGFPRDQIADRVARYLRLVRLEGLGGRRPHELSGGQQQRVAIARALVFEPDLLLLDEPLAALDKKLREDMQLEFRRIQQELGVTTINVTHDQREALVMSDRVLVMERGRVQQSDTPEETYARPANRFVAGFIGLTNFLPAEVIGSDATTTRLRIGGLELDLPGTTPGPAAGAVEVALRAERIRLLAPDETAQIMVDGAITAAIFEGDRIVYEVAVPTLAAQPLRLYDLDPLGHGRRRPGEAVRLGWLARDVLTFAPSSQQGKETLA